jgi:hypothetical protein
MSSNFKEHVDERNRFIGEAWMTRQTRRRAQRSV